MMIPRSQMAQVRRRTLQIQGSKRGLGQKPVSSWAWVWSAPRLARAAFAGVGPAQAAAHWGWSPYAGLSIFKVVGRGRQLGLVRNTPDFCLAINILAIGGNVLLKGDFRLFVLPALARTFFTLYIRVIRRRHGRPVRRCVGCGRGCVVHQYRPTSISGASLTTVAAAAMLAKIIMKKAMAGARRAKPLRGGLSVASSRCSGERDA